MTLNRLTVIIAVLLLGFFIISPDAYAAKGGNGGGKPGGDPPEPCSDEFPGFAYLEEQTRKSPAAKYLASADGCRREDLPLSVASMHLTDDASEGILMWSEKPLNSTHSTLRRADFTVDTDGILFISEPVTVVLPIDSAIPAEDGIGYSVKDIWGNEDHSELYIVFTRSHSDISTGLSTPGFWVLNLNDLSDNREIFQSVGWTCPNVLHPEAVATCYLPWSVQWNQSGTRLYLNSQAQGSGERWDGAVRLDIARGGVLLSDWDISAPELVFTVPACCTSAFASTSELRGTSARPAINRYEQPIPEYLSTGYFDFSGNNTVRASAILNADFCVALYTGEDGSVPIEPERWRDCVDTTFATVPEGVWQSPDTLLNSYIVKRGRYDVFRANVITGESIKLIENGRFMDTGY